MKLMSVLHYRIDWLFKFVGREGVQLNQVDNGGVGDSGGPQEYVRLPIGSIK